MDQQELLRNNHFQLFNSDACNLLKHYLYDQIVHTVVTSPPYYKKRNYGKNEAEIGWEKLEGYLENLVEIFDLVKLHPRGSVWVNIGDTRDKRGSLLGVPHKFSSLMTEHGWLLADEVVWAKIEDLDDGETNGCCMTEPAPGRLNANGFEMLFRFVKTKKVSDAWSDTCAVRIPRQQASSAQVVRYLPEELMSVTTAIDGRNLHNVWRVKMGQTRRKHFAVYPPALVERPLAMTAPPRVCSKCMEPWERIVVMEQYDEVRSSKRVFGKYTSDEDELSEKSGRMDSGRQYISRKPVTKGWQPTCTCNAEFAVGVVLDPFVGTGTTGEVALKMGRNFIGIDLYKENIDISTLRLEETIEILKNKKLDPFQDQLFK
jgi:site-specific DNA-methyltransferase (adenine-specific)